MITDPDAKQHEGVSEEGAQPPPEGRPAAQLCGQVRPSSCSLRGAQLSPAAEEAPTLDLLLCPIQLRAQ